MVFLSNNEFIIGMFGASADDAWVTWFPGDPGVSVPGMWSGCRWGDVSARDRVAMREMNTFVSISTYRQGTKRHRANFRAVHAIVLDDIGTKVPPEAALARMPGPTCRIETSPGNEQWWFRLDRPETDIHRVEALLKGLAARGLTDRAAADVTRYVRLPEGVNWKPKNGRDGFKHALGPWGA